MATIQYADVVERQLLPIDAQDIVTKVRLVVAGNRAGAEPHELSVTSNDPEVSMTDARLVYHPLPVVVEYEAPEHATYGCVRMFSLKDGINAFLKPTDAGIPDPTVLNFVNPGSPSAVRDGDPATFATYAGADGGVIEYPPIENCFGYALMLHLESTGGTFPSMVGQPPGTVFVRMDPGYGSDLAVAEAVVRLENTLKASYSYFVLPGYAGAAVENGAPGPFTGFSGSLQLGIVPDSAKQVSRADVYAFYPLVLNLPLLLDIAAAEIRLPAQIPQRVTVEGFVAPAVEHTIVGWPDGDYTGRVAQQQYAGGRTIIDFEQASVPVGLGLTADVLEGERSRRVAVQNEIRSASYGVMMGERQ